MHNFDKMPWMKKFFAYTIHVYKKLFFLQFESSYYKLIFRENHTLTYKLQNLLRATNPENVSSIGKIVFQISFLKGKNYSF